jgi:hypothetical protein
MEHSTRLHDQEQCPPPSSPERQHRALAQHLARYTSALARLCLCRQQQPAEQQGAEQQGAEQGALRELRELETSLSRLCPPPSAPSSSSPLGSHAGRAKHAFLLCTLRDLKQHVLLGEGGRAEGGALCRSPLAAAALSLCSVSPRPPLAPAPPSPSPSSCPGGLLSGTSDTNEGLQEEGESRGGGEELHHGADGLAAGAPGLPLPLPAGEGRAGRRAAPGARAGDSLAD